MTTGDAHPKAPAPLRLEDAAERVRIAAGALAPGRRTLFSLFRDEMFFAPAFFAHHRSIGVEQFLILDDGSTDGTRDFLAAQPDCALAVSDLRYGDPVRVVAADGRVANDRAGVWMKAAIPHVFLPGAYVTYVDADEFLFLPPGVGGLGAVIDRLRAEDAACCVASIVEFFPESAAALREGPSPATLDDLLAAYGWFQPEAMVEIDAAGAPEARGRSKSARLFEAHGLRLRRRGLGRALRGLFAPEYRKSPQFRTPIWRTDAATRLTSSHTCNRPAPREILLTIGHFVFTAQMAAKVGRALAWRAHVHGADKYEHYARLLERIGPDGSLRDARSERFVSAEQFLRAGLMRW